MINTTNTNPDFTYDQNDGFGAVRAASFLGQVFFYFGLALVISALGVFVFFQYLGVYLLQNPGLMWVGFAVELLLVLTSRLWSTRRPLNYVLFATFAFVTGVTIGPLLASVIVEFGGPDLIIKALAATTFTFAAAGIFGWITHRSLLGLRGFLFMALIGMIVVSVIGIFLPWGNTFEMVFSGIGVAIFSGYTMYDIQKLKNFPLDRPMDAALQLYLDIFNLFLYILRLIAGMSRSR